MREAAVSFSWWHLYLHLISVCHQTQFRSSSVSRQFQHLSCEWVFEVFKLKCSERTQNRKVRVTVFYLDERWGEQKRSHFIRIKRAILKVKVKRNDVVPNMTTLYISSTIYHLLTLSCLYLDTIVSLESASSIRTLGVTTHVISDVSDWV